jgi:hypothetical protein
VHCRHHAVQLHRARQEVEDAGASVVFVGQLTPRHAAHFRRRYEIDPPVLADKERVSYRAIGAKVATMGELLGPQSVTSGLLKTVGSRGKVRQGKVIGHPAQLGGAALILPDGSIPWSHLSENPSDNASPEEITEAVRRYAEAA